MFILALAAAVAAAPPAPDPAVAKITRLEQKWGQAFVTRDFGFIERIIAPEYRVVVASPDGKYAITRRAEWMKNLRIFRSYAFAVETVDVNRAGNTAVASAQGEWTVSRQPGEAPRATRFFVTDTWVRRNGQWQVIHRYSHRLPTAAGEPVMPASPQPK
ncbi:MAG TPA: nuclear transport factor 2 family protein [Sphingomicrobium sp.]|nr:nuclear transport factor 2 family protein [Sphingomicrobium sp.]